MREAYHFGLGLMLIGDALLMPQIGREMAVLIVVLWIAVTLIVVRQEEPALRRTFGGDYADDCRHVPRRIPRLRPFDKAEPSA